MKSLKGAQNTQATTIKGLKRTQNERASWPKTYKMFKYFHLQAFRGCSINIDMTEVLFWLQMLPPQGTAILRHSVPTETRTRLACGVTNIFPAYADFVHATD